MIFGKLLHAFKKQEPAPAPVEPVRARMVAPGVYLLPDDIQDDDVVKRLEGAVPPAGEHAWGTPAIPVPPGGEGRSQEFPLYGWVRGLLPSPHKDDCYIVAFLDEKHFRVLGYIDRYGRAFGATSEILVPPAEYPAIALARYMEQEEEGVEQGTVEMYSRTGKLVYPAMYTCQNDRYALHGSWFDFRQHGKDLLLDDALTRAFFAFVYRPLLFNLSVPYKGLSIVDQLLRDSDAPLDSLMRIVNIMESAQQDPAQTPPSLARCLAYWLREAGITEALTMVGNDGDARLSLVSSTKYSNLFYLAARDECPLPQRLLWKMEGALNRYRLIGDNLGEQAVAATLRNANLQVAELFENIIDQAPNPNRPPDANWDHLANEWDVRSGIARGMESLRLPLRFEVEYRYDRNAGEVFFRLMVPDADMMPAVVWRDDIASVVAVRRIQIFSSEGLENSMDLSSGWVLRSDEEREAAASDYAARLGLLLACVAFRQSVGISKVHLHAMWFSEDPDNQPISLAYNTVVNRSALASWDAWMAAARTNPQAMMAKADTAAAASPFDEFSFEGLAKSVQDRLDDLVAHVDKINAGHDQMREFAPSSRRVLGASYESELNINYNADLLSVGDRVAECMVADATEAGCFKILRTAQERSNDPQVFEACNRLMARMVEGNLDIANQNAILEAFTGPDRFVEAADTAARIRLAAFANAASANNQVGKQAFDAAAEQARIALRKVVDEADQAGVYRDNDERVYRVFDSSASRVIYNAIRSGQFSLLGINLSEDRGKQVELAPDGYYYCCLELLKLMEQSIGGYEEALHYGQICLRMAPTMAAGYRQMARAYMLGGDTASARETLVTALRFVTMPEDIALMYYQLAYVEWKAGHAKVAVACYLKAIVESSDIRDQASNELRALVTEEHQPLLDATEISPVLVDAGIPLAPNEDVMALLRRASRACVNEGLVPAAKNMLSLQVRHGHDDVLAHVLRSLG